MFIGAIKFTKNADTDKYGYSGYEIGFDRKFTGYWIRQKCNDFWSRCEFIKKDDRKKDILILGKGPTQGLKHTLSA